MKKSNILLALTLITGAILGQNATRGNAVEPQKQTFIVLYRPGPAWLEGKPVSEQPLKAHGHYMLSLFEQGAMKFAGPFTDNTGGAVVLEVTDASEAEAIVAEDPAVKSGIFVHEIHPWRLVPWEQYVKK